ncbi:recombinase family protein [Microcoleus sp. FACHB-1515]|uniref:recombinase family protein n=1 Tax=Cyanophyceae TaxID=3028117 RepID=UPI0016848F30|nr:recombinase family protein [Microcoleus sp. FACHB-1515]MBD2090408.1 recombinase family protein [Microcoleus sp. FACHB-1515]
MSLDSVWIVGSPLSGKTASLLHQLQQWGNLPSGKPFLVFAATGDNRLELCDRIEAQFTGRIDSRTPLGFFQDEVLLFWPLIAQQLDLKVQFPLRLRPETEQELATRLWQQWLDRGLLRQDGISEYFVVRRSLDIMQLAAFGGIAIEEIPIMLQDGYDEPPDLWQAMGEALTQWRSWCLDRGLLTYGIITDLYWRVLLAHPTYRQHLRDRYRAVLADDVDEYPAVTRSLFEFLLDAGLPGAFTFNPEGGIRVGLGADPDYLSGLANRCESIALPPAPNSLGTRWGTAVSEWISDPIFLPELPAEIQAIQTTSRSQLLRQTASVIANAIESGQVQPHEIAVIGAGVDAIARYTLREILMRRGIAVDSLSDQRPLITSPPIRALLSLMALVYPGLGRLLDRDDIAELLVILTQSRIDPVRAGLLTDYCFQVDLDAPQLLPATTFPRWDRLGFEVVEIYGDLLKWIAAQQHDRPAPVFLLDRAIQRFFQGDLPFDQIAALRELVETAQHYWDVDDRLHRYSHTHPPVGISVGQFIRLLRDGTLTADPFPVRRFDNRSAVTIATIYQYRISRQQHRWHFWLDVGSAFWLTGGGALFGAPLFLRSWTGRSWSAADSLQADQLRLQRQVTDLLSRVSDRVYLCHSELATNGQEQSGPLLSLANAATPIGDDVAVPN